MSDAPVAQTAQPEVEVKEWTAAEKKAFEKKHKPYRDAAGEVNAFIEFLREQHNIQDGEGWQLGDGCFIRKKPAAKAHPEGSRPAPVNRTQERERRAKKQVSAVPNKAKAVKPVAVEQPSPNGVPVGDVAL